MDSKRTICIHQGGKPDIYGGINTPVYISTAYAYLDSEERLYPRYFNIPNHKVLIDKLSKLEHAESGLIFSSGMAAISTTLLSFLNKGDHVVFQRGLYGGTIKFIREDFERFGIKYTTLRDENPETLIGALRPDTKVVYIESPSNPLLKVVDLAAIGEICRKNDLISVIDNTFASPINQNPIDFGIDVVLHSATKYLGGHSDISAGAVLSSKKLIDRIARTSLNFGGDLNALMCYLLERSLKTLAIRVERQNSNALEIAKYLSCHPAIGRVYYPGLPKNEGFKTASRQMTGFGGMLSFEMKEDNAYSFQKKLKLIKPAMSLGGVESTICSPSLTSHRHLTEDQKRQDGINDRVLRLSVGIEDVQDLITDLEKALSR